MTCVEPQRMRMTRSFSHYTDGVRFYLSRQLKIFLLKQMWCLIRPLREHARSRRGMHSKMWERACSRRASRFNAK